MRTYKAAQPRTAADEEAELRAAAAPMAVSDAIQRMLLAWRDRDYFRCVQQTRCWRAPLTSCTRGSGVGLRPRAPSVAVAPRLLQSSLHAGLTACHVPN